MSTLKPPKPFGERNVTLELGKFPKVAYQAAVGNYADAAGTALEAIGLEPDTLENEAFHLVLSTVMRGLRELVETNADILATDPDNIQTIKGKVKFAIEQADDGIEPLLFSDPKGMKFLQDLQDHVANWAEDYGLNSQEAQSFAMRLPDHFETALHVEYTSGVSRYPKLQAFSDKDSPFIQAAQQSHAFDKHRGEILQKLESPAFGDTISLKHLYIPLRAELKGIGSKGHRTTTQVDAESRLLDWLEGNEQPFDFSSPLNFKVRAVSGGPGAGKSTLAAHLAAKAMNKGWKVIFVTLQIFDYKDGLRKGLNSFLKERLNIERNDLFNSTAGKVLLIFDGLDELSLTSKQTQADVSGFIQNIVRELDSITNPDLRILLLGRTQVVGYEAQRTLSRDGQVLELKSYWPYETPANDRKGTINQNYEIHSYDDQRREWWERYAKFKNLDMANIEKRILNLPITHELSRITAEPLLNYLVARVYTQAPNNFPSDVEINQLYELLVRSLYQRPWGNKGNGIKVALAEAEFFSLLEHVAMCAWHGGTTRVAPVEDIVEKASSQHLAQLELLSEKASEGALRLLTAFYTAPGEPDPNRGRTFEFTHKSFAEYLSAKRIVRAFDDGFSRMEAGSYDERDFLEAWRTICGPAPISPELGNFVTREVAWTFQRDKETPLAWQTTAEELLKRVLLNGLPKKDYGTIREAANTERNVTAGLLLIRSACAHLTNQKAHGTPFYSVDFPSWLRNLNIQPHSESGHQGWLNHLPLSQQDLSGVDLKHANLSHSNLNGSNLAGAVFLQPQWKGVNLYDTNLEGCDFVPPTLEECDFSAANLSRAKFNGGSVKTSTFGVEYASASMVLCALEATQFDECTFKGVVLSRAALQDVSFQECTMDRVALTAAIINDVYWDKCSFRDSLFTGAQLVNAEFKAPEHLRVEQFSDRLLISNLELWAAPFQPADVWSSMSEKFQDLAWDWKKALWTPPIKPPSR